MQNKRTTKHATARYSGEPTVGIVLMNSDAAKYLAHLLKEKLEDRGITYQIVHAENADEQIQAFTPKTMYATFSQIQEYRLKNCHMR